MIQPAVLYSFRRCPYAIRARLALAIAGIDVPTVEVELKNKPQRLYEISPKATVPVLEFSNGTVLDQSLDIMRWALSTHDPLGYLNNIDIQTHVLISTNDTEFKYYLDRYKYADRYPENTCVFYREQAERFIQQLEERLMQFTFLEGNEQSVVDLAIFPFIRQFAFVDRDWFFHSDYQRVCRWLAFHLDSALFKRVMQKPN